jgi:hypothetical protein
LPLAVVDFVPETGAVAGWQVTEAQLDLACPDGRDARLTFVHPAEADGPLPAVVVYHAGAFDFVTAPAPGDPLDGNGLQTVSRLEGPWAIREVYATLGMVPEPLEQLDHTGALVGALAAEGIAVVLPQNCWGDLWHNKPSTRENDFFGDQFFRSGGLAAEWPYRLLTEPGFDALLSVEVPFEASGSVGLIGLGSGGRAVGEVLNSALPLPAAVAVEGHDDDLDAWEAASPEISLGLRRIFPGDIDRMAGAFSSAEQIPPTLWVYSALDPQLAAGAADLALDRLTGPEHEIVTRTDAVHLAMNRDPELAQRVAAFFAARL